MRRRRRMLRGMWTPADALSLTAAQRADPEALVRSGQTPQRVAARAMIVLAEMNPPRREARSHETHANDPSADVCCFIGGASAKQLQSIRGEYSN
jgi:hypothetical protein